MGWLTLPQAISLSTDGSRTKNLSLGERPVGSPVTAEKGPASLRGPSPRSPASSTSPAAGRLAATRPGCAIPSGRTSTGVGAGLLEAVSSGDGIPAAPEG